MIRMGAPVNLVNPYTGMTILAEVSINKLPFRFFAPLLAAGADPNIPDPRGQGPLHLVRGPNAIRMAEMLLENGAKVDLQDLNGMTPLLRAVEAEDFDLVRALIKAHANPLIADKEGRTPISVARKLGNERIIGLLAQI